MVFLQETDEVIDPHVGRILALYKRAVREALEYTRELKKFGIGQPWIDVEPTNASEVGCRIRLEVR